MSICPHVQMSQSLYAWVYWLHIVCILCVHACVCCVFMHVCMSVCLYLWETERLWLRQREMCSPIHTHTHVCALTLINTCMLLHKCTCTTHAHMHNACMHGCIHTQFVISLGHMETGGYRGNPYWCNYVKGKVCSGKSLAAYSWSALFKFLTEITQ